MECQCDMPRIANSIPLVTSLPFASLPSAGLYQLRHSLPSPEPPNLPPLPPLRLPAPATPPLLPPPLSPHRPPPPPPPNRPRSLPDLQLPPHRANNPNPNLLHTHNPPLHPPLHPPLPILRPSIRNETNDPLLRPSNILIHARLDLPPSNPNLQAPPTRVTRFTRCCGVRGYATTVQGDGDTGCREGFPNWERR